MEETSLLQMWALFGNVLLRFQHQSLVNKGTRYDQVKTKIKKRRCHKQVNSFKKGSFYFILVQKPPQPMSNYTKDTITELQIIMFIYFIIIIILGVVHSPDTHNTHTAHAKQGG